MLKNARVTAFTVSQLLRENQQEGGGGSKITPPTQIRIKKQFSFQKGHSTEHAVLQLVDQTSNSFEKNLFTLGAFSNLSQAFDTVDHDILICKLKNYGVRGNNLKWFKSDLNNQKQFISSNNKNISFADIKCDVP